MPSEADALVAAGDEASLRRALELEPGRADAARPARRAALPRAASARRRSGAPGQRAPATSGPRGSRRGSASRTQDAIDLAEAFTALDAGEHERALDLLIAAIPSADGTRDDVRRVVVAVLDELGVEHPLARDARRRLAAALY